MLNTAIVGLGWWGKTLVKAARDFGASINFVRGVTLEPDSVRDFAAEHKIAIGTSFEDVLADAKVQAVILATPHSKHREQVEAAARAKKHIYCEKPFALSKADAVAMLEACKRAGIVIGDGHHFRLMPSMRVLDELMQSGAFGAIMHVEGNYSHDWLANVPADSWRSVAAESRAGGTTAALIEFENGATGTLATTLKTPFDWRIAVYGENCRAESVSETRAIVRRAGQEPEIIDRPADFHLGRNLDYFAKAALGQGTFPISPAGILQTAAALEAVFKSVDADGTWMTV